MNIDMSGTIVAKSDQINASDITQPTVLTITDVQVKKGDDQPTWLTVAEYPGRYFKPGLTVRRIIAKLWGNDGSAYVGRQLEIYNDPTVRWAGQEVGGIRVSRMSHIEKPEVLTLPETRGKWKDFRIEPLPQQPQTDWQALLQDAQGDRDKLLRLHQRATNENAPQDILDAIIAAGQQAAQPQGE